MEIKNILVRTISCNIVVLLASFSVFLALPVTSVDPLTCAPEQQTFELVTAFVFTAPDDTLELVPGTLHLTDCLSYCRHNASCRSVNYETGLCVLFSSSATQRPEALTSSQFPVFTIYAQKICLDKVECNREWIFERVSNYELLERTRKSISDVSTKERCMEFCLSEKEFECRSANYHGALKECQLSDVDRHSVQNSKFFVPAEDGTVYLESNCVDPPVRLCEFHKVGGKILKTVDAVFRDVKTLEGCRKKCLSVNYRCHSFDLGDPNNSVCRLSHLASPTLANIEDPYLEIHGASTYEIAACYNVTIQCRSREMVAFVRTGKVFNGKVYVKSRPNSCVTDVINSMEFEIRMAYHDLNCDVKQEGNSEFSNDIVIQHHDMIVTNQDLGVTVHCQYDLSNKSVAHGVRLEVSNDINMYGSHSVNVGAPNVTMKVTDRLGRDLFTAQVGDPLLLKFEIMDVNSPYDIFVRELVAMDGIDNSEILLIDALGCPTDTLIMGSLQKARSGDKVLHANFDAFKFPTSEIVQFKALVTPCLPACEPADCSVRTFDGASQKMASYGKKRRRRESDRIRRSTEEDELVVVQTIHITDKFGFDRESRRMDYGNDFRSYNELGEASSTSATCLNTTGLIAACTLFLIAQLIVLLAWAFIWHKKLRAKSIRKESSRSIDMIYNSRRESAAGNSIGIDNPYRSDISPYDTVYTNAAQSQCLQRRY
ncbi:uncharacterized protein LOC129217167 isoform X2 [Uloborus diversus]|uniref:uncharacterized protein LOC129217167 isoform X2 n=1 Tax=Uloborus diversus TaxID=327109 RepID=UPI00240A2D7A|nr:uncharacterized protein LOC129217167 isoform X2 [Uloborus diversus]